MEFLCLDFINSEWRDWRGSGQVTDQLPNPEWRARFLNRWGLQPSGSPPLAALQWLRAALRQMVEAITQGEEPGDHDLNTLQYYLDLTPAGHRLRRTADGLQIDLVPATHDWNWVMSQIALSFARLLAEGDRRRVKLCENENCRWAFYDESRNRNRRWCDDKACGNLLKVRRFRARQKNE